MHSPLWKDYVQVHIRSDETSGDFRNSICGNWTLFDYGGFEKIMRGGLRSSSYFSRENCIDSYGKEDVL